MTYLQIQQEVARNLKILASDDATIISGSTVTTQGIKNKINAIYQDSIGEFLIRKYPQDFEQTTYPMYMYRQSFTVANTSSGTTLISTTPVFANGDESYKVALVNGAFGTAATTTVKINTYVSTTQVTTDVDVTAYIGYTAYILGNEFTLNGAASDAKEIVGFNTKYNYPVTSNYWNPAELRRKTDIPPTDSTMFTQFAPIYYLFTGVESRSSVRGFGILPRPRDYRGQIQVTYTQRIPAMVNNTDTPKLEVIGISDVLVNGVTAWGWRILGDEQKAMMYDQLYQRGIVEIERNYRPRNRSHASKLRQSDYFSRIQSHRS
jgi:hypothetical protein